MFLPPVAPASQTTTTTTRRPSRRLALVVALAMLVWPACSPGEDGNESDQPDEATASQPNSSPTTAVTDSTATETTTAVGATPTASTQDTPADERPADEADAAPGETAGFRCEVLERSEAGAVERVELVETSGLAASRQHEGVLWATNDSGQRSGVYALDRSGGDLGFFALTDGGTEIDTVDVEDLAIADDTLYLADIGDNATRRGTVAVHAVAEPAPGADGSAIVTGTVEIQYPDGPTDAEALIVDPVAAELVILSKDLDDPSAPTRIYLAPLAVADGQIVTAVAAGTVDVTALTASSDGFSFNTLLFPGSVTGADLSPAGDLIAIRTYGSVWLFPRRSDQSVAEALTSNEPCEAGSAPEAQGEAITFLADPQAVETGADAGTIGYATISEGGNPPVNLSSVQVSG